MNQRTGPLLQPSSVGLSRSVSKTNKRTNKRQTNKHVLMCYEVHIACNTVPVLHSMFINVEGESCANANALSHCLASLHVTRCLTHEPNN